MSTLVVTAAERLTGLEKCPFEANTMGAALASLQVSVRVWPLTAALLIALNAAAVHRISEAVLFFWFWWRNLCRRC